MDDRRRPQAGEIAGGDGSAAGSPEATRNASPASVAIVVAPRDSIADVLGRLPGNRGRPVRLVVPPGSALFLTAAEFRSLKDASDRAGVETTIETEDPLRRQLATMFGLRAVEVGAPARPRPLPTPPPADPPVSRTVPTGSLPPPTPLVPRGSAPGSAGPAIQPATDPGTAAGRSSPLRRQRRQVPPTPGGADGEPSNAWKPRPSAAAGVQPRTDVDPERSPAGLSLPAATDDVLGQLGRRRRLILIILAAVLAAALIIAAGLAVAAMTLTTADVVVELRQQPVTSQTTFRVVADGGDVATGEGLIIPGRFVTVDVTVEQTAPATGSANVGETPASGIVQLANPGEDPVEIPAGTTATGDAGLEFRFPEAATVPGASNGVPGQAESAIEAVTLGTVGNLDAGELSGRLDSGVYFSNRMGPLSGGSDREGTVVTEDDLEALRASAEVAVPEVATERFAQMLQDDMAAIPSTFEIGEPRETFDRAAGDAAEQVTIRVVYSVTALTYAGSDLDQGLRDQVVRELSTTVPAGYGLDESTIRLATPVAIASDDIDPSGAEFSVGVSARAVAQFSPEHASDLAERLSGADDTAARETLQAEPAIEEFSIRHSPGWLARGMPDDADRIEIRVED